MKTKIIIAAMFFVLFLLSGFSYGADSIIGTYSIFEGRYFLIFQEDGHYVVKDNNDNISSEGSYVAEGDQIALTDVSGPVACSGAAKTGKYKWNLDGDKLTFTVVDDKCEGRKGALTAQPFTKEKESK